MLEILTTATDVNIVLGWLTSRVRASAEGIEKTLDTLPSELVIRQHAYTEIPCCNNPIH